MKIFINATNIHTGGGRVMLIDFLNSARKVQNIKFVVYVNPKFNSCDFDAPNINFYNVTLSGRVILDYKIKKNVDSNDIIISFGSIPPFIKHKAKVILLLSNRYLIENYPLTGLSPKQQLKSILERIIFKYFCKNADWIIVQSLVMRDLLVQMGISDEVAKVMPYKNKDQIDAVSIEKIPDSFLYVASDEPHKNHKNLIYAWMYLAEEGIRPSLYLTIDRSMPIYQWMQPLMKKYDLKIEFLEKLPRAELFVYYNKVRALIYPSYFESYGLPLLEAKYFDIPILASELDYVRDLLDPDVSFDPHSPRSISRAVKRFLKHNENRYDILTADNFIKEIISLPINDKAGRSNDK